MNYYEYKTKTPLPPVKWRPLRPDEIAANGQIIPTYNKLIEDLKWVEMPKDDE
jgi:hypothetical protein